MEWNKTVIKEGSGDSASILAIKKRLNLISNAGLDSTNANYGPSTAAKVTKFQIENRLLPDGEVGELTWDRLFNTAIADEVKSSDLSIRAEQIAFTQLAVREATNHNDGTEVEKFLHSVGLGKGYSWCMAFVFWCFLRASIELFRNNPVPQTAGVLDCYYKAKKLKNVIVITREQVQNGATIKIGDQGILDFGKGAGHTFIVTSSKNNRVYTVEGNTSADPAYKALDREGNGVFERNRPVLAAIAYLRYS